MWSNRDRYDWSKEPLTIKADSVVSFGVSIGLGIILIIGAWALGGCHVV